MVTLILSVIGLVSLVLYLFKSVLFKPRRNLAPGPIIWPVIGNVLELAAIDLKYPHIALAKFAKKYGNIVGFGFGSQYSVLLSGYEEMREILKKPETCEYRFISASLEDRNFNQFLGIVFSGGDAWREIRNFTLRALRSYGFGKKASMEVLITEAADQYVKDIDRRILTSNGVWNVDIHHLSASVLNVVWAIIAGKKIDPNDPVLHDVIRLGDEIVDILSQANIYNTFPALRRWFPKLVKHDVHMKIHSKHYAFIKTLITEVSEQRALRVDTEAQNFMESFLDEIENSRGKSSYFTEQQMVITMSDLFMAGSETTSMVITWPILFLTLNQECQHKLRQEILQAKILHGDQIPMESASKLPYLNAVILEAYRLGNGLPITPPRMASEDIQYNGIHIPKGTVLIANLTPVFMDETFWGDPEIFRPERFLNEFGEINPQVAERVAMFGFGKRRCIGDTIAWDTIVMFMTAIFEAFTLEPIKGREPSAENPIASMTVRPRPFQVQVLRN